MSLTQRFPSHDKPGVSKRQIARLFLASSNRMPQIQKMDRAVVWLVRGCACVSGDKRHATDLALQNCCEVGQVLPSSVAKCRLEAQGLALALLESTLNGTVT